jgi:hypothetical protein
LLRPRELEELGVIGQCLIKRFDSIDNVTQRRAFPAKALGAFRICPDRRIFELTFDFLEAFAFDVVVKGTPLAQRRAH